MERWLIVLSGTMKGSVIYVTGLVTIGRAAGNTICLDDELASQNHCAIWIDEEARTVLQDGDTRNGTLVNGRAESRTFLKSRSYIKCGGTPILYGEGPLPENLDILIEEETARNRGLETLRADYTVREQPVVFYRGAAQALLHMADAADEIADTGGVHDKLLDSSFEMIPAIRGAILLNGRHVGPELDDFPTQVYRKRDHNGPARFTPIGNVLRKVYETGEPYVSNEITPVICVPLKVLGAMRGVIYLEAPDPRRRFEPEHLLYAKGLARFTGMAIRLQRQYESMADHIDVFRQKLKSDYLMIGESRASKAVSERMEQAAACDCTVLILGETGTGKELIAHGIHELSQRRSNPFVTVNCGSIMESLVQSELFGHVRGAFTDATADRKGKLELAGSGTAFLDEIGELTPRMQQALLRFLQDHTFEPVGKPEIVEVDVRIIAATNVDLEEAVRQKQFRQDLFYRLNVFVIEVPPLRERREDIPLLARHFLEKHGKGSHVTGIAPDGMDALVSYSWPGNIRDLENVIEAAIITCKSETIGLKDLDKRVTRRKVQVGPVDFKNAGNKAKRALILQWMEETGGTAEEAADCFGISKQRAYQLLAMDFTDSTDYAERKPDRAQLRYAERKPDRAQPR
jgi:Nif-specific regulatory protein